MKQWMGCPMINPLCPEDVCLLPYGHEGMLDGKHILSTTPWDTSLPYHDQLVRLSSALSLINGWADRWYDERCIINAGVEKQRMFDPRGDDETAIDAMVERATRGPRIDDYDATWGWDGHAYVCWCGNGRTPSLRGQKIHRTKMHGSPWAPPSVTP